MTLHALGYDPVPGDPDAVHRVAMLMGSTAAEAETITNRLGRVGAATGPQIWRGPAAEAFRRVLDDLRPDVERLARSHREAQDALGEYAFALDSAQDMARRADSAAVGGKADRERAAGDRRRAADEARAYDDQVRDCEWHLGKARVSRLLAPADPVYQAQMDAWETRTRTTQNQARTAAVRARGQETAARTAESTAAARVDAAMLLAGQAKEVRDVAARRAVDRLDTAGRTAVHRNPITRVLDWIDDTVRTVVTDPRFGKFLDIVSRGAEIVTLVAIVAAIITAIALGGKVALAILAIGLPAALVLGIINLLGTALGKGYGVRDWGDVAGAALGVLPAAGRVVGKLAGPTVRRVLPWADRAAKGAVRRIDGLYRSSPIAGAIKQTQKKIPALKVFTPTHQREIAEGLLDSGRSTLERMWREPPNEPTITPLPAPQCDVPTRPVGAAVAR